MFLNTGQNTHNLFFGDKVEVRTIRLNAELHNPGSDVVHVECIDDLIAVFVVGGSDVYEFPVQGARERGEALEGYVEEEGVCHFCWVVPHRYVVYVHLRHLARYHQLIIICSPLFL